MFNKDEVKILLEGQSAGNFKNIKRSSETTRITLFNNLCWASGFIEAEGSLRLYENRIIIMATQSIKNIKVLYRLKSIFKVGVVKIRKDNLYADWKISTKKINSVIIFLNLINGFFVSDFYFTKYCEILDFVNNKFNLNIIILPKLSFSINNPWLSGFFEGDGCFNVQIRKHTVGIRISITQKNKEILKYIKIEFTGNIYEFEQNNFIYYLYQAGSIEARELWISYFKKFKLVGIKNIQYIRWVKCHNIIKKNLHKTKYSKEKIKAILKMKI